MFACLLIANVIKNIKEKENFYQINNEEYLEIQNESIKHSICISDSYNNHSGAFNNNDSFLNFNLDSRNLFYLDYEAFLQDFCKAGKIPNNCYYESNFKGNLSEINIIESVFNSYNDYNSISLLDLLDDDIFSIDFQSKTTNRNSGESILNTSKNNANDNAHLFYNSKNRSKQSPFLENSFTSKPNIIDLDAINLNNRNSYIEKKNVFNYKNINNIKQHVIKHNFEIPVKKENKEVLFEERKMLFDDNEVTITSQNFSRIVEPNSPLSLNFQSKTDFENNYNLIFNQQTRKESFSKTKENLHLNSNGFIQPEIEFGDFDTISIINNIKQDSISNNKLEIKEKFPSNDNENSNKYLLKKYKFLQNIYRKYKKYKNLKIQINCDFSRSSDADENINKILDYDKNLQKKSESLLNELIKLRKDYKSFFKNNKKIGGLLNQNKKRFDSNFLRNSISKQIDVLMRLINLIKMKIDLIRNNNNKFTVINSN